MTKRFADETLQSIAPDGVTGGLDAHREPQARASGVVATRDHLEQRIGMALALALTLASSVGARAGDADLAATAMRIRSDVRRATGLSVSFGGGTPCFPVGDLPDRPPGGPVAAGQLFQLQRREQILQRLARDGRVDVMDLAEAFDAAGFGTVLCSSAEDCRAALARETVAGSGELLHRSPLDAATLAYMSRRPGGRRSVPCSA